MSIRKVLNIEDTALKHVAIARALNKAGVPFVECAKNGDIGIEMVEKSIKDNRPYDLIITDMHFPIYGEDDFQAGIKVIRALHDRNINIPIVVCSSVRYNVPEAADCIFYNEKSRDIDSDIREMLEKLRR